MNKYWYNLGNPFKVKHREHHCYKCGERLFIRKHYKVVSQKTEEAKYYDFNAGGDGAVMVGPCEFIHKVFYCKKCSEDIEFVTQLNQEDIDIIIDKVKKRFAKKGRTITIIKRFENQEGETNERISRIEQIKNVCLFIEESGREPLIYKVPLSRKECWERPYYFKVTKRNLLKFIKNPSSVNISASEKKMKIKFPNIGKIITLFIAFIMVVLAILIRLLTLK